MVDQNSTQIYEKATFDREYTTSVRTGETSRVFCNSPVHEQCSGCFTSQFWFGDVCQHWQQLTAAEYRFYRAQYLAVQYRFHRAQYLAVE
jgi:hypothetical protein